MADRGKALDVLLLFSSNYRLETVHVTKGKTLEIDDV